MTAPHPDGLSARWLNDPLTAFLVQERLSTSDYRAAKYLTVHEIREVLNAIAKLISEHQPREGAQS